MKSAWIAYDGSNNSVIKKLDQDLIDITELLLGQHVDFHFGDETLMRKYAKAETGKLIVGKCSYRVDQGEWQEETAVIHMMKKLLKLQRECDVEQDFKFTIETFLDCIGEVYLIGEEAEAFEIKVNNHQVKYQDIGWWKDTSFKKVAIRDYIQQGENHIYMTRHFYQSPKVYHVLFDEGVYETEFNQLTYDVELESIYLIGDFGVKSLSEYTMLLKHGIRTKGEFVITEAPKVLEAGDFTRQGLCFFAGKLNLSRKLKVNKKENDKIILDFGRIRAVLVKVFVNGEFVSKLMWEPFLVDVSAYVKEGENELMVEVYSSNRNLLGPHHHVDGEIYNVGPMSFTGEWTWCERPTEGVEAKEDIEKSYWNEEYCFVTFGV